MPAKEKMIVSATLYGDRIRSGERTIDLINYMSNGFSEVGRGSSPFQESKFLGFFPIIGAHTTWGVVIDGTPCAGVHLFRTIEGFAWGDDPRDTVNVAKSRPWVLMFYGNDNSSCFLRFGNRHDALTKLSKMAGVDNNDKQMLFYNS